MTKDREELKMLQRACDITEAAFRRTLGCIKPDLGQWEIEAELLHEFVRRGSLVFVCVLRVFHCANLILRPSNMPMEYQKQVIELIEF
jgi:Xaa-Pro aminopeptidase